MSCNFPVCSSSPPSCILAAFKQSGYFSLLNPDQQAAAQSDPVGWLNSHPYLYAAYPQYFSSNCGAPITPGRPPDYYIPMINNGNTTQQNASQVANQINQNPPSNPDWWDQFLQNLQWYFTHGLFAGPPPSLQNTPPQNSPNNPPPSPQIPSGTGYPNTGGQKPEWLLPFEDFGNWLLSVGKGVNDFLSNLGNVYAEAVTVSGEHPWGVVLLIIFLLAIVGIFFFLPKL
jgi:hypothetical protein